MEIMNITKTEYGIEGTTWFDLFGREIEVMMDDTVNIEYANKCVGHLNSFNHEIIELFCEAAIKYCFEFSDDVGAAIPEINEKRDVLKYVYPKILIINEPEDESKVGYHMECNCEWEIEHGLEFTILEDKLLYLGSFNDEAPWQPHEYYKNISWNHVFNEPDIFDDQLRDKLSRLLI
ncbi:MAG: hypothetical protein ACERKV_06265 [Clostridiaceae bacterium]